MTPVIRIGYKEIEEEKGAVGTGLPSLKDLMSTVPQDGEDDIVAYLRGAPNYSAMGKVVGDAINPASGAVLYPGTNTDGLYLWPMELAYYVETYHIRIPADFVERMASLNWRPPTESSINYENLHEGLAG